MIDLAFREFILKLLLPTRITLLATLRTVLDLEAGVQQVTVRAQSTEIQVPEQLVACFEVPVAFSTSIHCLSLDRSVLIKIKCILTFSKNQFFLK